MRKQEKNRTHSIRFNDKSRFKMKIYEKYFKN